MQEKKPRAGAAPAFALQFDPAEICNLSKGYQFKDEQVALDAGVRISKGKGRRHDLCAIYKWKTKGRGISRLCKNTDGEIEDALKLAVAATTERAAVAVLLGLEGIDIAVASAVLTAIDANRYTIIDFRALEALGVSVHPFVTIGYYLAYLGACRELATRHNISLRVLDRALWQWSKERSKVRRHRANAKK